MCFLIHDILINPAPLRPGVNDGLASRNNTNLYHCQRTKTFVKLGPGGAGVCTFVYAMFICSSPKQVGFSFVRSNANDIQMFELFSKFFPRSAFIMGLKQVDPTSADDNLIIVTIIKRKTIGRRNSIRVAASRHRATR